jgi:hypothetical protein
LSPDNCMRSAGGVRYGLLGNEVYGWVLSGGGEVCRLRRGEISRSNLGRTVCRDIMCGLCWSRIG